MLDPNIKKNIRNILDLDKTLPKRVILSAVKSGGDLAHTAPGTEKHRGRDAG